MCEVKIKTAWELGGVLCSAHTIPAGYSFWSRRKEFKLTGLVVEELAGRLGPAAGYLYAEITQTSPRSQCAPEYVDQQNDAS